METARALLKSTWVHRNSSHTRSDGTAESSASCNSRCRYRLGKSLSSPERESRVEIVTEWTDTVITGALVGFVMLSLAAASAQCQSPYIKGGFETVVMNLPFTLTP